MDIGVNASRSVDIRVVELNLTPLETKYLYKDGVQNTAWDNGVYNANTSAYVNDGGWTLNDANMSAFTSVAQHQRMIVSHNAVDVSQYSKLKLIHSGTTTVSIDVSSIKASGYIYLYYVCGSDGTTKIMGLGISNQIDNCNANRIGLSEITTPSSTTPIIVNRIWLEK